MNNKDMTIRIITEEAKEIEASVISLFEIKETGNKYAIYTFNEEDAQGLVKIYSSKISEIDGLYNFVSISDAEEWSSIKAIMKYMAKENNDGGTDGGKIELISAAKVKAQMNEPISVNLSETKAAKIGPNYKSGITNTYLNNVKNDVAPVEVSVEPTVSVEPVIENVVQEPTNIEMTPEVTPIELPQEETKNEEPAEPVVDNSFMNFETPKVEVTPEVEIPSVTPTTPSVEPAFEMPEVPSFNPEPINNMEVTKEEVKVEEPEEEKKEESKPMYNFDIPSFEENEKENEEESNYEEPKFEEREVPSVDSVLNKASYYQNRPEEKEEKSESNENIIQSIGLEFMKKVSELAEYEKDLNKRNRDLESKERLLTKLEKEMANKEEKQRSAMQLNKDKEIELRRVEKELADKDNDLNRRIMEFNKKISMFQQTFETISKVD